MVDFDARDSSANDAANDEITRCELTSTVANDNPTIIKVTDK